MSDGFAPIARPDARVLVLGTLPGKFSLERGEYFAQPRNVFWRIMGEIVGASPELPYQDRVVRLLENGIALWDVCAAAHRPGSLDSAIKSYKPNDFRIFLEAHKQVRLICFNGAKASEIYCRDVLPNLPPDFEKIRREVLPSTSPAFAAMPFAQKLSQWQVVVSIPSAVI
jgi:TDG/mug DNA glycosylase family protein